MGSLLVCAIWQFYEYLLYSLVLSQHAKGMGDSPNIQYNEQCCLLKTMDLMLQFRIHPRFWYYFTYAHQSYVDVARWCDCADVMRRRVLTVVVEAVA